MTTIREQIILADKALVDGVSFIKTSKRIMMKYEELKLFALTQIPVAAVVGRLPKPEQYHRLGRRRENIDQIQSNLIVDIYVYFQCTQIETMDTEVSDYANQMFTALFVDGDRGGLCLETVVELEPEYLFWDPFVAFKVKASHLYLHNTGGI